MNLEDNMEELLNMDVEHVEKPNLPKVKSKEDDQQKDYEYTRGELYYLIDQGQEAVKGALEVAQEILLTFTQSKTASETVKSLRNYQLGATYSDAFGRESPVFSSINSSIFLDKTFSNTKNVLTGELKNSPPDWATHFKLFVKETSSEYYNMALDRFYFAQDGNVWLSFPSAERNKITEDTFLLLKKKHDKSEAVTEDARYKVLDISNEAPRFISTETIAAGKASCKIKTNPPEVGSVFFKFSGPSPQENPDFATAFKSQNQIEITTDVDGDFADQNTSKRYTI